MLNVFWVVCLLDVAVADGDEVNDDVNEDGSKVDDVQVQVVDVQWTAVVDNDDDDDEDDDNVDADVVVLLYVDDVAE